MNASESPSPPPARHAPMALWRVAEAFMHILCALFGNPCDVAADHTYLRKDHALLASWLRCAEAMLRRLLVIEAAAYADATPARSRRRKPRKRERKLVYFYPDKPEDWRVTLRLMERRRPAGMLPPDQVRGQHDASVAPESVTLSLSKGDARAQREPKRLYDAWPLALRYEALVRAFNQPVAFAKRLARKLRAAPQLIAKLLRAPPEAVNRIDDFELMGDEARTRWSALNTT